MNESESKHTQLARVIVQSATLQEQEALEQWATRLLELRKRKISPYEKLLSAIRITTDSKILIAIIKHVAFELKRVGWDDRSWKTRLGLSGILVTLATVGSSGAGIAALGGAIGVPLWVIFGAGAGFAGAIIDEVRSKSGNSTTTYTEMHAERKDRNLG